jgi:hypothetical protein
MGQGNATIMWAGRTEAGAALRLVSVNTLLGLLSLCSLTDSGLCAGSGSRRGLTKQLSISEYSPVTGIEVHGDGGGSNRITCWIT